jgi:uncharacterized membrane protein YjfL (UPF0719 family)
VGDLINVGFIVNSVMFSIIGVIIFWLSFIILDKLVPYKLWHELLEEHNTALAIVVGAMALGICIIIAASIHG